MFPLFSFIVLFLSYVTAVCFLSRFPTLFRQISLTLTLFFPNSFAFLSLFLFLMSLLSYCLSFVHCISSILSDFVALSVVPCLSYLSSLISLLCQSFFLLLTSLLYICLSLLFFLSPTLLLSCYLSFVNCISSILSDFVSFLCRSLSFLPQCSVL